MSKSRSLPPYLNGKNHDVPYEGVQTPYGRGFQKKRTKKELEKGLFIIYLNYIIIYLNYFMGVLGYLCD
jgi:hypothetical protein